LINLEKLKNLNNDSKQGNGKITAIELKGNENISTELIKLQIASNLGDIFYKENIVKDAKAIYKLGYFKDVSIKLEPYLDGHKVLFVLTEYLPIKKISISGNKAIAIEEMKETMVLKEGKIFNQKILKEDLKSISQIYKDRGYLLVNVKKVKYDEEGMLWITISEGHLEKIMIEGNNKTSEKLIIREIIIEPGELFDFKIVKKSLQNIYNLGYFEDVTMRLEPGSNDDSVILVIKMIEKSRFRDSIDFIIKNVSALFFFFLIYIRLFFSILFYKTLNYLPKEIHPFISSGISIFIIFSFIIVFSYLFLEKSFYKKYKLQYFLSYFKYLFLFPFLLSYKIIEFLLYFLYQIIKIISIFFRSTINNVIQIMLISLDIIIISLIMRTLNNTVLIYSMFVLMLFLILHLQYLFNLIINPNLIYLSLYNLIENIWNFNKRNEDKKISTKNDNLEDIKLQQMGLKIFLKISRDLFNMLKRITNKIYSKKGLLYTFILFFIISIMLTIIIFSFDYYALSRINNNNFQSSADDNYFEYLYSSMTIYSTVQSNDIIPLTVISKLFVMLQILLGIILFYIFIVSFQMVASESAKFGKEEILKRINLNINYLESLSEREIGRKLNDL
jgi:hypothetical protein